MKKLFSFITLSLTAFLAVCSFFPKSVLADGMVIKPDPYSDRWDYSNESNQQAFINYDNGLQKMIISVGLEGENSNGTVWLFPIPSDPNKVVIDVVKSLPQLSGEEISKKSKSNLSDIKKFLQITQIWTFPIVMLSQKAYINTRGMQGINAPLGLEGQGVEQDVVVYEHLEKEGITSEIITARTATGLYDYLRRKGLKIESGSIPALDNYIGKEFSFVASWISSYEKITSVQRGIFVTFPTQDIYFPMLPTSVYGSKTIPVTIRIIGYVSPKIFQDIKTYARSEYYIDRYAGFTEDLKNFYNGQNKNVRYTKIGINAPSKFLTDDLWISRHVPIKTYYSSFIAIHPVISAVLLLILSSLITGILVGLIVFSGLRKNIVKLGLIGLSNCLSIFGLLITTALVGTKEKAENADALLAEIKQKGYFWKRKLATILLLANLPFLVISVFTIPSLIEELANLFGPGHFYATEQLMVVLVSVAVLAFCLIIRRTKPEDKILFEQLKSIDYSSWSFQPKDKMKIVFVPIFSFSFLVISWLLGRLVEITV